MKKQNSSWLAFVLNPLIMIVYGIVCYYLSSLAQYGGVARRAPIVVAGSLILFIWFAWCLYRYAQYRRGAQKLPFIQDASEGLVILSRWWAAIAAIALFSITSSTGVNIYQSATNLQGELGFFLHGLENTRKIELVHDNLYEDGLEGLFEDIDEEIPLPEELYVSNEFDLTFDQDGQITSLYSLLYGLNEENQTESFLIDYDSSKSNDMRIHLNGHAGADYNETMKLQPLMDMMDTISVKEAISGWNEDTFGIYYAGVRDWGYNTEGILSVDAEGKTEQMVTAYDKIIGYTVSVHAPENDWITSMRFVEMTPQFQTQFEEPQTEETIGNTFFLNQQLGFRLTVADAALGSRFYTLGQTLDGGKTWETLNPDPFLGTLGSSSGITFIDEQLGFIGLSKSGGAYSMLYRTTDGGITFEQIDIPAVEVPLTETEMYAPFDSPGMPYKGVDNLMMEVGQGQDGDHNGGTKALYQSTDDGATWEFVAEVK